MPDLNHLSMLNNDACPNYFNGGTLKQYRGLNQRYTQLIISDYRLYVINRLQSLAILDDQPVTEEEKKVLN
jgi:hypothetical protein